MAEQNTNSQEGRKAEGEREISIGKPGDGEGEHKRDIFGNRYQNRQVHY